jgi:hypothetical protein
MTTPVPLIASPWPGSNGSPRGAPDTQDSLRKVLGYAHATILDDVSAEIPVAPTMIGPDGEIHDERRRGEIRRAMLALRGSLGRGTRE